METLEMLSKVYGEFTMARSKVYEWHLCFIEGRESIKDNERIEQPLTSQNAENVVLVSECELPTGANGSGKSNLCCDITMCMMLCVEIGNAQAYRPMLHLKRLPHMCVKAQKAFINNDSLAQLILVGNLDDSNAELTSICDTANCVWEKLLSVYEQSSGQRLDRLMEKFFHNDKELEDDIVSHIAKLQRNFSELNDELRQHCRIFC
ncbi:retrovirus-related Pol polyprotein from transposon TNT 1-94 [Trichonephila clavipes]|nr:retrovirus-related Pol polyprotein from transposon TNT 1-94 [Trichonephila clavipes]